MSNSDILRKMYKNGSLVSVVNMSQEGMAMPANIETWTLNAYGQPTSIELKSGVTSIPEYWQASNHVLSSVTMPGTLVSIGDYAFQACTSLSSITIPNTVTSIGNSVFSQIGELYKPIDISKIDLSNVMNFKNYCFSASYIKGDFTISNEQMSGSTSGSSSNYGYAMFSNAYVTNSGDTLNVTAYADGRILPQLMFGFSSTSKGKINVVIHGSPTYLSGRCFGGPGSCSVTFVDCTTPPNGDVAGFSSPFYNFGGTVYVPNSTALYNWQNKYSNYRSIFKVIGT